jgi:tRNA threonylcarbamoyladenosine biosynthesis protein TsaB
MKILALEFSSPQRSVAVLHAVKSSGERKEHEAIESGSQANKPFELIERVIREANLEREEIEKIAIGLGPGSYNGMRAAIALAQGWQLGRKVQLQGISSVEVTVAQAQAEGITGRVAVVIDAQRGEFYLANYEISTGGWKELQPLRLVAESAVTECHRNGETLIGPELRRWFAYGKVVFPRAVTLAKLAAARPDSINGESLEPIYLRPTSFVKAPPTRILPDSAF